MKRLFILTFTAVLFSINGYSQESLSLADAIQIGLKNNFQIQISGLNTEIAERNNNWLEAGALPSISVSASQNNNWSENNNPTSFIQGKFQTNSVTYGADLNWVLFGGFKVKITKDKLQQLEEQSIGNGAVVVENTVQSIILGYNNALLQKEKLSTLQKLVEVSADRFRYMESKKELGSASTFDLLQTKNALLTDSTNYLLQELAYKNALRNLNMLMAIDVEKEYELSDNLQLPLSAYEIDGLKAKMLSNNQTLKNQYINQEILRKDKQLARAGLFPVISFGSGLNQNVSGFSNDQFSSSGNESFSYYANFTLSWTLFNGNKTHRAFQNMKIQEEIALLTTDEMKLTLTNELITAYELYAARKTIFNLSEESLNTAEMNMNIAKEKFKSGSINSFEYRDIQNAYLNTAMTRLEAMYNVIDTHTDLTRMTGGIIEEFKTDENK